MRKTRSPVEIYNDLDDLIVNLFRVLRDPVKAERLRQQMALTPLSRVEMETAWNHPRDGDDVERARKLCVVSSLAFGTVRVGKHGNGAPSGFRCYPEKAKNTLKKTFSMWAGWPTHIPSFCERLQGVIIESKPAIELIQKWDAPDLLVYADPPYLHETRVTDLEDYGHEMTRTDHVELARCLRSIKGMVVVSGYDSDLYRKIYGGWQTIRMDTHTFSGIAGGSKRTETLWLSPSVSKKWLL